MGYDKSIKNSIYILLESNSFFSKWAILGLFLFIFVFSTVNIKCVLS